MVGVRRSVKTDAIIDRFVERLAGNGVGFEKIASAPWIERFEERLQTKLPRSFSSLVNRYSFPVFEFSGVVFFSNSGTDDEDDLVIAPFRDKHLGAAVANGFVQIGRPDTGSYDLVCFNTRGRRRGGEYPIVVLDHEPLLQHDRLKINQSIGTSFWI